MIVANPIVARRKVAVWALQLWDVAVLVAIVVMLAPRIVSTWDAPVIAWLAVSIAAWHLCFTNAKLYESRRLTAGAAEVADVVKAVALATASLGAAALLFEIAFVDLRLVVSVWGLGTLITVAARAFMRRALAAVRRSGRNLRHVVVVGSGPRARQLAAELGGRPELGYRFLGYVDEREDPEALMGSYLGRPADLGGTLATHVVDEVFVALPIKSCYDTTAAVVRACEEQGVGVSMPVNFFDTRFATCALDVVEGTPMLRLGAHRVLGWRALGKRVFDVAIAAAALAVAAPAMIAIAIAIRSTSPGPVLFRQDRIGRHKRVFRLAKFRTMVVDAEAQLAELLPMNEATGPVFKLRDDPRVTPLGRFLRRTSLDELPQLFNVLWGDMSLVGPRPLPLRDVAGFSEHWQRKRFSVKPGITCFWQVRGRSRLPFREWMELDMQYIDHWSFALDVKLLALTIPTVLRRTGAY